MRFEVITIFPELVEAFTRLGLIGKAVEAGRISVDALSPREFTTDRHRSVDDTPYGGGSGMVMSVEPLAAALDEIDERNARAGRARNCRVLLTPQGAPFDQARARELCRHPGLTLLCGRYEGVDERVRGLVDLELSLGDFVLNGGEVAALAVIEAVGRLVPGVVGNAQSLAEESHSSGLLEYPQYTRPREFRGQAVPEVLLSGNHAAIERWRRRQSLLRTRDKRPDLFERAELSADDERLLDEEDEA